MNPTGCRGRGMVLERNVRIQETDSLHGTHSSFKPVGRGRGKRLIRPSPPQPTKLISEEEMKELTSQMAAAELKSEKRTAVIKNPYSSKFDSYFAVYLIVASVINFM